MDDITESYVTHWYMFMGRMGDRRIVPSSPENAAVIDNHFAQLVAKAGDGAGAAEAIGRIAALDGENRA